MTSSWNSYFQPITGQSPDLITEYLKTYIHTPPSKSHLYFVNIWMTIVTLVVSRYSKQVKLVGKILLRVCWFTGMNTINTLFSEMKFWDITCPLDSINPGYSVASITFKRIEVTEFSKEIP